MDVCFSRDTLSFKERQSSIPSSFKKGSLLPAVDSRGPHAKIIKSLPIAQNYKWPLYIRGRSMIFWFRYALGGVHFTGHLIIRTADFEGRGGVEARRRQRGWAPPALYRGYRPLPPITGRTPSERGTLWVTILFLILSLLYVTSSAIHLRGLKITLPQG